MPGSRSLRGVGEGRGRERRPTRKGTAASRNGRLDPNLHPRSLWRPTTKKSRDPVSKTPQNHPAIARRGRATLRLDTHGHTGRCLRKCGPPSRGPGGQRRRGRRTPPARPRPPLGRCPSRSPHRRGRRATVACQPWAGITPGGDGGCTGHSTAHPGILLPLPKKTSHRGPGGHWWVSAKADWAKKSAQ